MEVKESVNPPGKPNKCSDDCPFCKDPDLKNYKTKKGSMKDEKKLRSNLRNEGEITSDSVGNVYPLPGGGDRTIGWEAKPGALETFAVRMAAAPHHIIPGKAAMDKSKLEKWTVEGSKIKQDIGYNIDGAQNGVFLPHLPEIYWTKHKSGTKTPQSKYYGVAWSGLSASAKESIGFLVQGETWLQMHYTDHDDPYVHMDHDKNYDKECKNQCNLLNDLMTLKANAAKCKDADSKLNPPYELVSWINEKSSQIKMKITGNPKNWTEFVSPLAQDYANAVQTGRVSTARRLLINQLRD